MSSHQEFEAAAILARRDVVAAERRAVRAKRAAELFDEAYGASGMEAARAVTYLAKRLAECEQQRDTIAAAEAQAVRELAAYETPCCMCSAVTGHQMDGQLVRVHIEQLSMHPSSARAADHIAKLVEAAGCHEVCPPCEVTRAKLRAIQAGDPEALS